MNEQGKTVSVFIWKEKYTFIIIITYFKNVCCNETVTYVHKHVKSLKKTLLKLFYGT